MPLDLPFVAGGRPGRRVWLALLTMVVALLSPAGAHVGGVPDMVLQLEGKESQVLGHLTAPLRIIEELSGVTIPDPLALDASASEKVLSGLAAALSASGGISLDGVPVTPIMASFTSSFTPNFISPDLPGIWVLDVFFAVPSKGEPRQIGVRLDFPAPPPPSGLEPIAPQDMRLVQAMVVVYAEGQRRVAALTASEPEYVWHSDRSIPRPTSVQVAERPPPRLGLPLYLVLQTGIVALLLWALPRQWLSGKARLALLAVSLGWPFLWLRLAAVIPCPFAPGPGAPAAEEALEIFASLHRNVYRAFDYGKEGDIYDTLARSVDGRLLKWIYNEIYQSLILRTEGGAVCQIQGVQILQKALVPPPAGVEEAGFRVNCRWKVRGVVEHWGHAHSRVNLYEAVYTVAPVGGAWKIVDVEILDQEREAEPMGSLGKVLAGSGPASGAAPMISTPPGTGPESAPEGPPDGDIGSAPAEVEQMLEVARMGEPEAQLQLAEVFFKGLFGVAMNKAAGIRWLERSAEAGNPRAQSRLGTILYTGDGVEADPERAHGLFLQAAAQDDLEAQFNLAVMYDAGEGVAENASEAVFWYKKAAVRGKVEAEYNLGMMYYEGKGVARDSAEAVTWFTKAADRGAVKAQFTLGVMFANGMGVVKDLAEAFRWFKRAAEGGDPDGQYNLGVLLEGGMGCDKNPEEGLRWLRRAAEGGSAEARASLARRPPAPGR